jgi:hypothetical protein
MSCLRAHSLCGGMLVLAAFGSNARAAESEAPPTLSEAPVQAIWKAQEIAFTYQSFTTFYSCSSLEAKIRRLLIAVGAEPNLKIRTRGCFSSSEIARMPYVEIQVVSPVEATPEELAELDKTRSTRELAARVRGDSKQAERAEAQFPAQWTQVSLSRGKLNLEPGDCELIEQLKEKVLPKLAIKVIEDRTECTPHRISMTQPRLVVEALTPMASPDEPDKNANEKEEEEEKEEEKEKEKT